MARTLLRVHEVTPNMKPFVAGVVAGWLAKVAWDHWRYDYEDADDDKDY